MRRQHREALHLSMSGGRVWEREGGREGRVGDRVGGYMGREGKGIPRRVEAVRAKVEGASVSAVEVRRDRGRERWMSVACHAANCLREGGRGGREGGRDVSGGPGV